MQKLFGLLLFNIYTPTCIWCSYRNTLASEVKCLRVIERRDLSNERNTFKSKTIFYHKKTRLNPERATRPIPKRRLCTRPLQGRFRKEEGLCTRKLQGRSRKEEGPCTRQLQGRSREEEGLCTRQLQGRSRKEEALCTRQLQRNLSNLLKGSDIKRTSRRTVLLKGSDIKRTSRRTAPLKSRNTRTIQLLLRHLKGIGIEMTPLSDWLSVLPRGSGIAGVTELHYHLKVCHGMLYCTSIKKL